MLTELKIKHFIFEWFKKLDNHADISEMISLLSEDGLEMKFPEAVYTTIDGFKEWYNNVINIFFDEIHELKIFDIVMDNNEAIVDLIVNWQTKTWEPPAAKSVWKGFDCYQHWVLVEDDKSKKILIKKYVVDKLVPMYGSAEI